MFLSVWLWTNVKETLAAIALWYSVELAIKRLLTPGLIPELATLQAYFPLRPSSLRVVVAQPDERLANKTPQKHSVLV